MQMYAFFSSKPIFCPPFHLPVSLFGVKAIFLWARFSNFAIWMNYLSHKSDAI